MSDELDPLEALIGSVSDGAKVDWDATLRSLPKGARHGAQNLRDVARIASFHRNLQHPHSAPAVDGEHWGHLLLLERIGSGSSADVYRAWDSQLRREVALKLLRQDAFAAPSSGPSPLIDEGRAAARIRHPHVVTVHGIDVHAGRVGLWMELIQGKTLEYILERNGRLSADAALALARELGAALTAVHAAGLLHRDLKPANVVRDLDGRHVLTDFGLGTRWDDLPSAADWRTGTPMYMAPEVLNGAAPSVRSDIYALGMMLRFAVVGQHAFATESLQELRAAAARGPQQSLAELRPDLPSQLLRAIETAIAPEPAQRFGTASAWVDALQSPVVVAKRSRRPRRLAWLPLAASLAALALFALWLRRDGESRSSLPPSYEVAASFLRREPEREIALLQGDRIQPGDHLSLRLEVSRAAWVYVLNEDEQGERYLLYPQPSYELQNPLAADSSYVLPGRSQGQENVWTVTSAGGQERFLLVVSPEPVAELESELAKLPAPRRDAEIVYAPIGAATIERLRGVGGLTALPVSAAPASPSPLFEHFRALAGRETELRGVWVRQFVLQNSS